MAERERIVHSIPPTYDERSRVLVLGSMPSPKSRELGFNYGHPQNRFWRVMAALADEPVPSTNERKRDFCLRHHIALWDVLAECEIEGASDASISNAKPNRLADITNSAPIEAVFCTGAKAYELYKRLCDEEVGLPVYKLPSTSPANAACSMEALVEAYAQVFEHVHAFKPPALDVAKVVETEQAIAADGTSLAELMDRAGTALAYRIMKTPPVACVAQNKRGASRGGDARVVILCGNGNNGGDGWVAARDLAERGIDVTLVSAREAEELKAQPAHDAACAAMPRLVDAGVRILIQPDESVLADALAQADVIVDALLGTGFTGATVKEPFDHWIELCNERRRSGARVIAADVPSGLNVQTGEPSVPCVKADETVTMIVPKTGFVCGSAREYCGDIRVAPLAYVEPYLG